MRIHTSDTDPLRIDAVPAAAGEIGISFCPGKHAARLGGGIWRRDLDADLARIRDWGAVAVLTLIEDYEFDALRVTGLPRRVAQAGMDWHHLPIVDSGVPNAAFEQRWPCVSARLHAALEGGQRVFVHCRGGLGRAGTISARLLVEMGETAPEAIRRVRAARPGAIETDAQFRYVLDLRSRPRPWRAN